MIIVLKAGSSDAEVEDVCGRIERMGYRAHTIRGEVRTVIDLAEELLGRHGGLLFEVYRLDAPPEWRRAVPPNSPDKAVWFSFERQEAMDK